MPYGFTCDGNCGEEYDGELPAFMGDIRESWFKSSQLGGRVAELDYSPGQTITLCGECLLELLE